LRDAGILPEKDGWSELHITPHIDMVVLGTHARVDNPELLAAQRMGIPILSFPEYVARHSMDKIRLVVAGSHGKTTTTSAIMHALNTLGLDIDYMVGSQVPGFSHPVKLSAAPVIVLEGDEYLSSAIDPRPKFLHYKPQVCIITGIAWDHINVFPTLESYVNQFRLLMMGMSDGSRLIINSNDQRLAAMAREFEERLEIIEYGTPEYIPDTRGWILVRDGHAGYRTSLFGRHNMENLLAASLACAQLGVSQDDFFAAVRSFAGPSRRLELLRENTHSVVYNDFAHAPSKVRATIAAAREQFPTRKLVAVLELHTYSSLNREFLAHYRGTANAADQLIVFLNAHAMAQKGLNVSPDDVLTAFGHPAMRTVLFADEIADHLVLPLRDTTLLMMTSGNFGGLDLAALANLAIA
jgi:UDP-N-acetylmuramate: L-alanyl-gamma-D-glutamyl-meso-diaminopimelate ligase